ncbi:MAG: plastocyanin/azurin family copper-binding protein [Thermoleophilaceae bacterium]
MKVWVTALLAGVAAAALVTGLPASAADQSVAAGGIAWDRTRVDIAPGEKVTWSNKSDIAHNVCVAKPGTALSTSPESCTEFRNGDSTTDWSGYTNAHTFSSAGTYAFECQSHPATMQGIIVVGGGGATTTSTSTTPTGTGTTPTETAPTQTQTSTTPGLTTPVADTTAPRFTTAIKRRAGRKALTLAFGSSEAGRLEATVFRRPPHRRSYARVGQAAIRVSSGRNTVTVPRKAAGTLRRGAYRVKLALLDATGNRSAPRLLIFKLA